MMTKVYKKQGKRVEVTILISELIQRDQRIKTLEIKIAAQEKTIVAREKDNAELQEYVKRLSVLYAELEGQLNNVEAKKVALECK